MLKKISAIIVMSAIGLTTVLPSLQASSGEWEPIIAKAAWNYGDYRIEKLHLDSTIIGPFSMGEHVLFALPHGDGTAEAFIVNGGSQMSLGTLDIDILNEKNYLLRDNRLLFTQKNDENGNRFSVHEIDLATGIRTEIIDDVFFTQPAKLPVVAEDDYYLFNPEFGINDRPAAFKQAAIYEYDAPSGYAQPLTKHWTLRHEELLDIHNKTALLKMTFESGHEQLFLMNGAIVDGRKGSMKAIPNTWTEPDGDIVGAHFTETGKVEYFQYFVRHTYTRGAEAPVRHSGEVLNWNKPAKDGYQIVGDTMAFIGPDDSLYLSENGRATKVGEAAYQQFRLQDDKLFYRTPNAGMVYDLFGNYAKQLPLGVVHAHEDYYVGLNGSDIIYHDVLNQRTLTLGYGSKPVISDAAHVYWRGVDGNVYEATIMPEIDNDVFGGKMPIGTKVKSSTDDKVYLIGRDGKLHWITNEKVAFYIFGAQWNTDIIEMPQADFVDYQIGDVIMVERDYHKVI